MIEKNLPTRNSNDGDEIRRRESEIARDSEKKRRL